MRGVLFKHCWKISSVIGVLGFFFFVISCFKNEDAQALAINIISEQPISWEAKQQCKLIYVEGEDSVFFSGKVRFRGGISKKYFKHSYTLKIDKKYSIGHLKADNDWILNASYIDKTFMRHKLSFDLFRQMNPQNVSPECNYIEVFENGTYQGLYVLMERLDATRLGLVKTDTMAMIFKDPPIFYDEQLTFVKDSTNFYRQKFPAKSKRDQTNYISDFHKFIFHAEDSLFVADIFSLIDKKSLIDWHLLLLFTNNSDGLLKNFFFYKQNAQTPFRIAVWDYDHSFGRDVDYEYNMAERNIDCNRSVLFRRINELNPDGYNDNLIKRWEELRKGIFTIDNINTLVSKNSRIIKQYLNRNAEKWPLDGEYYMDTNTFEEELEIIRKYVDLRLTQLDRQLNGR